MAPEPLSQDDRREAILSAVQIKVLGLLPGLCVMIAAGRWGLAKRSAIGLAATLEFCEQVATGTDPEDPEPGSRVVQRLRTLIQEQEDAEK